MLVSAQAPLDTLVVSHDNRRLVSARLSMATSTSKHMDISSSAHIGDILHEIVANFPRSSIIALVRDKAKAAPIEEKYSQVTLLQGDLDSASLIEDQAARADVVISQ